MSLHRTSYSPPTSARQTPSHGTRAFNRETRRTEDHLAATQTLVDLLRRQRLGRNSVPRPLGPRPSRRHSIARSAPDGASSRGSPPASYSHPEDYLHRFDNGVSYATTYGGGSRYGGHPDHSIYDPPPPASSHCDSTDYGHCTRYRTPPMGKHQPSFASGSLHDLSRSISFAGISGASQL